MSFAYYDVQSAAAGGQRPGETPEERQLKKTRRMIHAAEQTNYDGDPQYYQQIKALALQAGIPIKSFKTNPFRLAKTGLLSALDTAAFGLLPNSLYEPQNEAEQAAASIGSIGGMIVPWGGPARAFQAGKALMGGSKFLKSGAGKKAWDAFLRRSPKGGGPAVPKGVNTGKPHAPGAGAGTRPHGPASAFDAAGRPIITAGKKNMTNQTILLGRPNGAPIQVKPGQRFPKDYGSNWTAQPQPTGAPPIWTPGGAAAGSAPSWQAQTPTMGGVPAPTAANVMPRGAGGNPKILESARLKNQAANVGGKPKQTTPKGTPMPKSTQTKPKNQARANARQDGVNIKVGKNGQPTKSESIRIKQLMKPKQRRVYAKLRGKDKQNYLIGWAKNNGYNITVI